MNALRALDGAPLRATLVDRRNFHLFQPLLYQVATGSLSPGDIAAPLRNIFGKQKNAEVLLGEAVDLDASGRRLILSDGSLDYDILVLASGSTHSYFGHDEWAPLAPGLKTIEDATEIRGRVLTAFEAAEREPDPAARHAWLTFIIVGAGPTGVELAGALGEITRDTLRGDFRSIEPQEARILLVEGADRVLPGYPPDLSAKAEQDLIRLGVRTLSNTRVTQVDPTGVTCNGQHLAARTVIWAAGVRASRLGAVLARRAGAQLDRAGRVHVQPDLTLPGHPEIFVLGDLAIVEQDGKMLPGVAPVAISEGKYVARAIRQRLAGEKVAPYRYFDKGSLATIGRGSAIAQLGKLHLSGWVAWLLWLFIHLMYLVGFQNRVLVFLQWGFQYLTYDRRARLITGPSPLPFGRERTQAAGKKE